MSTVETARLLLRPWEPDDLDELARLNPDPVVMRYISGGRPLTYERVAGMLERGLTQWRERSIGIRDPPLCRGRSAAMRCRCPGCQ